MQVYKCERCGAPLDVSPETIVAVCPYCGFPNHISGNLDTSKVFIVPSLGKGEIERAFWERVRRDIDLRGLAEEIELVGAEGHYAPYWLGRVRVHGIVRYTKLEEECRTYTDANGNPRTECHTVERHYTEKVDEILNMMGPARRQVKKFGVEDVLRHFRKTKPKGRPLKELEEDEWDKMKLEVLNTEFDEEQAKLMMHEDAIDVVRDRFRAKATRIDDFSVKADEPRDVRLLLLPMWTVYYRYGNSIYQVVFAGWDGRDVVATEPMTSIRRAEYVGGVMLGSLIGAFSGAYGVVAGSGVLTGAGIVIGAVVSGYFGFKVLEGQRIERGG